MDKRQKLQTDLKRYRSIRDLISDERTVAVLEELIKETKDRLSQIEDELAGNEVEASKRVAEALKQPERRWDGRTTIRA